MPWSQKPRPIIHYSTPCIASFSEDDWFFFILKWYQCLHPRPRYYLSWVQPLWKWDSSICEQSWARASSAHWWSGTNAERVTTKLMSKLCGGHPLSILKNGKTMWPPPHLFLLLSQGQEWWIHSWNPITTPFYLILEGTYFSPTYTHHKEQASGISK